MLTALSIAQNQQWKERILRQLQVERIRRRLRLAQIQGDSCCDCIMDAHKVYTHFEQGGYGVHKISLFLC